MGEQVDVERENAISVCVSFNPFSPHSTDFQGENILSNASLLVLVWLSEGFFYFFFPSNSVFSQFRPLADWMGKNPRRRQTVCWKKFCSRDFRRRKRGRTRKKYFIFYSTPRNRKGKTFESSRRPKVPSEEKVFLLQFSWEKSFLRKNEKKYFVIKFPEREKLQFFVYSWILKRKENSQKRKTINVIEVNLNKSEFCLKKEENFLRNLRIEKIQKWFWMPKM